MFFVADGTFMLGCLGCGLAPSMTVLGVMRALTGLGRWRADHYGDNLINFDIIPLENRGMYQAVQNGLQGFGAVCEASMGGVIADTIGWRWCFICQVPVSLRGLVVAYFMIQNPQGRVRVKRSVWRQIDLSGVVLLVPELSVQLAALSLGGNQYPWSDSRVIVCSVASVVIILTIFVLVVP